MMIRLRTKNGRPLQVAGSKVYSRAGVYVGRIHGRSIHDPSGRYAGTIVGNRVVYRSTDSACRSSPSMSASRAGSAAARVAGSAIWGDEPRFSD